MITVAIAEDDAPSMRALQHEVAALGYKILLTAPNGKDLLQQLQKLKADKLPTVLLLDINMPYVNGLLVTTYCSLKYPSIKIVGVSSHTNERLIREVLAEGANCFISKYFLTKDSVVYQTYLKHRNVIQEAIQSALKGEKMIDELIVNEPNKIGTSVATKQVIAVNYHHLKPKLIEFAILNAAELSFNDIASLMNVSYASVKDYCKTLCAQFNVADRHELTIKCMQFGIIKLAVYYDDTMAA
jgi:DNA-binding NarL/FixJ family response regulator